MTEPIVVGLDGSPASLRALRYATRQARRRECGLRLVHALAFLQSELPMEASPSGVYADLTQEAGEMLSQAQTMVEELAPEVRVDTVLVPDAVEAVLEHESEQACVLVLGRRGHGGFTGLLTGSVSQHIADHAHCPVVVVPHGDAREGGESADPPEQGQVVAGVDGDADHILRFAFEEAALAGARLRVVHAWRPPLGSEALGSDEQSERLAAILAAWQEKCPGVEMEADSVPGKATNALTEASRAADLLVIGTRRPHHIGARLGAVAHGVIRHAHCPVAVVPGR
jgi:nucleotide-binding universal stress UspA family protein